MAQNGLHGIMGLTLARITSKEAREPGLAITARSSAYGFVMGNVLPDIDLIALGVTYLFDSRLAMKMHRSATHSIFTIALVTFLGMLLSTTRGGKAFFRGLGTGMLCHSFVDIFLWLSSIDILWPLGYFGVRSEINLWTGIKVPPLWNNFLGATDFLMVALFFGYLIRLSRKYETNTRLLPRLRAFAAFHWVCFPIYLGLSFFLSRTMFDIVQYSVIIVVSIPMTWMAVVGSRPTIERLGVSSIGYR
ncbi:MAG: metal-dependent hydrolase [Bacillota bacterium]